MNVRITVGTKTVRKPDASTAEVLALVRAALDDNRVGEIHLEIDRSTTS